MVHFASSIWLLHRGGGGGAETLNRSHGKPEIYDYQNNNNMKEININYHCNRQGVGTGGEGGVLKRKIAGCLLYILLLTTSCFYYLWDGGIGTRIGTIPAASLDDSAYFFAKCQ